MVLSIILCKSFQSGELHDSCDKTFSGLILYIKLTILYFVKNCFYFEMKLSAYQCSDDLYLHLLIRAWRYVVNVDILVHSYHK